MPIQKDSLIAQNSVMALATKRNVEWASAYVSADADAGADVVMEASWDGGDEFVTVQLEDPNSPGAYIGSLAKGYAGFRRVAAADVVRLRRTDANGGACVVSLSVTPTVR